MTKFKSLLLFVTILMSDLAVGQLIDLPARHLENQTFEYEELIQIYRELDMQSERGMLMELGVSDEGLPIHAFVASNEPVSLESLNRLISEKTVLAINNAIHPGESCGVDASLHFINTYLGDTASDREDVLIVIVPMYNIGGGLNRSCCSRANQDGPISQGFRGNARNYDLNRDLIKADTRNTLALYRLFDVFDPHLFIDTHSTNGADYPYEMTLITSPWQKYPEPMQLLVKEADSLMLSEVGSRGTLISPYVNVFGRTPNSGFTLFPEGAMYTTGYAALHGSIAFVTEAHMLKPYEVRVNATRVFLEEALELASDDEFTSRLKGARRTYRGTSYNRQIIQWEVDMNTADTLDFISFEAKYVRSKVTGEQRLKYTEDVEEVQLPYYNRLKPIMTIVVPRYYYVPIGQWEILERFDAVGIRMDTFTMSRPDSFLVEQFHVDSYGYADRPYEGHVRIEELDVSLNRLYLPKGQYVVISSQQTMGRYLQECLHPLAPSSFTRWNFFDAYLQQKEGYSSYVWEDTAAELLEENEDLEDAFEAKKKEDEEFANSPEYQLYWIYTQSPYYERAHMNLPYYISID